MTNAAAKVETHEVQYRHGDTLLLGFFAWPDALAGKRPGVLVVHEWWGHNENMRNQAIRLAKAGYVAFALDLYGKGKVTTDAKEAEALMLQATGDVQVVGQRFEAGLAELKKEPRVDAKRIGVIGFCMGGSVALNMARAGVELNAVATFHALLNPRVTAQKGKVKPRLLVLTGEEDPMVPPAHVEAFKSEMSDAGADFEVISYPGAKHGFTNPEADKRGLPALAHNAEAAKHSWEQMLRMFNEVFGE